MSGTDWIKTLIVPLGGLWVGIKNVLESLNCNFAL